MIRATQWQPLCDADPTPGKPDEVQGAGQHYAWMADEIDEQVQRLKNIVDGTLQGGYVRSLTTAAEGLKDELGRTSGRYREVGGVLQAWAPQLEGFQDDAERLRQQAVAAQGDMTDNRDLSQVRGADAAPPSDTEVAATKARHGRYDDARGDLSRAQGALADLVDRRDTAAARIADAIRDTCDDDVANSGWDDFKDWMDDHAAMIEGACKVLGVIAMAACVVALFVPGLNVVAAGVLMGIAIGASSASLIGHSMLASTGNGSWWDVGMDVVALATFGAGRFLGPGIKVMGREFGGALGRVTAETKAAGAVARGNAARGPIQARINADVARSQQRLVGGASRRVGRSVRREVSAIRAQGQVESQVAFDAAETAYAAQKTTTTLTQRLVLGGGDPELAVLRVQAQNAARGFTPTSRVGLAAARANAPYWKAVVPTGLNTVVSGTAVRMDLVPVTWYDEWRQRFVTRAGGDL